MDRGLVVVLVSSVFQTLCHKKKIVWVLFQLKKKSCRNFEKKKEKKRRKRKKRKWVFDLSTRN